MALNSIDMEDSDSPPPKIIIEADSWLQDTENSEIGGGNGDEPNVSKSRLKMVQKRPHTTLTIRPKMSFGLVL